MSPERLSRIEELYHAARERKPHERAAFLDDACQGDLELRSEIESLLIQQSGSLFDGPPWLEEPGFLVARTLTPGSQIGPYRIIGTLGSGGMGVVYKAHDSRLKRDVAIKFLSEHVDRDPQSRARFEREARAVAALSHPNICPLFDIGPDYLVMEYIEGLTLADRIERGPLPLQEALTISIAIAGALGAAHRKGIVHRDLKPGNIMLTDEGHIKLLDFGLARLAPTPESETASVTAEGQVAGTVGYMSPEQVRGLSVNHRTDIFSFGVVLYEMITRLRPFPGNSAMAVCDAILNAQPRDFGENTAPPKLKFIIGKLLEKDPSKRHGSADEVQQELKALEASLVPVRPVSLSRNAWIAVGAAVVLLSVLAGWLWERSSRERWALQTATPEITRLVDAGEYVKAASLTREARAVLPKDPALEKLWIYSTGEVSVATEPSGADVSIRPYRGDPNVWRSLGRTPLQKIRVPRDAYVWRVAKPGFAAIFFIGGLAGPAPPGADYSFDTSLKLRPEGSVPPEMVVVPGEWVSLTYPLAEAPAAEVGDFLIDRNEVTNEKYKKFIDAGGYQKREFWKQPFVRDGRAIPWENALALFHDAT